MTLALALTIAAAATPGDWPRFRGPSGAGVATDDAAYPTDLSVENALWSAELPPGHSSPCVVGPLVVVTGHTEDALVTIALDRTTGKERWRRAIPCESFESHHDVNGPASASPASDGERVFVHFGSHGLVAYDLEGEVAWEHERDARKNTFGSAASPVTHAGRVLLVHDTQETSTLDCLDAKSGEVLWSVTRKGFGSGWSTPTVVRWNGRDTVLVYGAWWLVAYDLEKGSERWRAPGLTDEPITCPVEGANGTLIVTSYNMKTNTEVEGLPTFDALLADLDANGNGTLDEDEIAKNDSILSRHDADGEGDHPLRIFMRWMDGDRDGEVTAPEYQKVVDWVAGFKHANGVLALTPPAPAGPREEPSEASVTWSYERGVPECPSPVVHGNRVYFVKNGGLATCLDAATGELVWQERTGARGPHYASPVVGGGLIYTASARGEVSILKASDEFEVAGKHDFGERIMATPALSNGVVFVRTERGMHAFGAK